MCVARACVCVSWASVSPVQAFLNDLKEKGESSASAAQSIIGQFGVGFYSTFMVGDLVTVYTRSSKPGSTGYKWISDG